MLLWHIAPTTPRKVSIIFIIFAYTYVFIPNGYIFTSSFSSKWYANVLKELVVILFHSAIVPILMRLQWSIFHQDKYGLLVIIQRTLETLEITVQYHWQ